MPSSVGRLGIPAKTLTCAVVGLKGALGEVEVDIRPGFPALNMVGLTDAAVHEATEAVRAHVAATYRQTVGEMGGIPRPSDTGEDARGVQACAF